MIAGRIRTRTFFIACVVTCAVVSFATAHAGETLERVQSNGVVRCGVSEGIAGFSIKDANGRWTAPRYAS
jgi:general L-amino acid transport system substrate-binding protein